MCIGLAWPWLALRDLSWWVSTRSIQLTERCIFNIHLRLAIFYVHAQWWRVQPWRLSTATNTIVNLNHSRSLWAISSITTRGESRGHPTWTDPPWKTSDRRKRPVSILRSNSSSTVVRYKCLKLTLFVITYACARTVSGLLRPLVRALHRHLPVSLVYFS